MKKFPTKGLVFWAVGTGDSVTVCIDKNVVMQIDLHNLEAADDDEDPRTPIIDRLKELLPKKNDKPYLPLFVLTHPDLDHCKGFTRLLKEVTIGEIWFAPRIFREAQGKLCDDAIAFRQEAKRRVKANKAGNTVSAGDRVRVIGYSDILKEEDDFKAMPDDRFSRPGDEINEVDGVSYEDFSAFVHAPLKEDDSDSERNETSIAMQVALTDGEHVGRVLLFGDLSYPSLRKVWDITAEHGNEDKLKCEVFLSPHQCSKSVMYDKNEDGETEVKQDILDDIENSLVDGGYIIASCDPIPASNKKGDNPPHAKAKSKYEEIVAIDHFLCTGEHPNEDNPQPIRFEFTEDGFTYIEPEKDAVSKGKASKASHFPTSLAAAISASQGNEAPPTQRVGFGRSK